MDRYKFKVISIAFALASFLHCDFVSAAAHEIASPIVPPYAAERKLHATDFARFEWKDDSRNRTVPAKIYFPTDSSGPFPVVIFSHGLGGTREGYEYLGRQWAANGYVVVHLQHPDSDDSAWKGQAHPMQSMRQAANAQNSILRAQDVHFAIDQLDLLNASDEKLKGKLDLKSIGMAGHSFGANTTMMVIGQKMGGGAIAEKMGASLPDDRIKAAIAMSAPAPVIKKNLDEVYAGIHVPLFVMTGTKDDSPIGETTAADRLLPFEHIKSNAYLVNFNGGDHMIFSGRLTGVTSRDDAKFQNQIRLASTAFWDANLKNDSAAKKWLDSDEGFKAELGDVGVFQKK